MPCQGARSRRVFSRTLEAQARLNRLCPCVFSVFQSKLGVSGASSVCPAEADGGVKKDECGKALGEKESHITSAFFILNLFFSPIHKTAAAFPGGDGRTFLSFAYSHLKIICTFK